VEATGEPYRRGRRVCATCGIYDSSVQTFLGQDTTLVFDDEEVCAPNPEGLTNPWCAFCPGNSGWFGLPGGLEETTSQADYFFIILSSLVGIGAAAACHIHDNANRSEPRKELPDDDDDDDEPDGIAPTFGGYDDDYSRQASSVLGSSYNTARKLRISPIVNTFGRTATAFSRLQRRKAIPNK
jgi:hypothetical protein